MRKMSPEERRKMLERGEAARGQMQAILDRVEARRQARIAEWERRGFLRRLFS